MKLAKYSSPRPMVVLLAGFAFLDVSSVAWNGERANLGRRGQRVTNEN